jgi:hypothetical protein
MRDSLQLLRQADSSLLNAESHGEDYPRCQQDRIPTHPGSELHLSRGSFDLKPEEIVRDAFQKSPTTSPFARVESGM